MQTLAKPTFDALASHFERWRTVGDMVDQCIDLMLNLRQSGHPGGSRSKVPMLVASTLGAGLRYDFRRHAARFADRFVLVAGHCNPAVYALLAVYNEALRRRHAETGDPRYAVEKPEERALYWEHLLHLRHNKGLPGHAEMEGNTLFFKFNTGPSGHGAPAALGEALALKHAGAGDVKVFAVEGEGGFSAGAHHEVLNSAYGLGLDNLVYLLDWNDHGIDSFANSEVMHGEPESWFAPHGWRVAGAEDGEDYAALTRALLAIVHAEDTGGQPGCVWFKTRKGRGYHVYDAASHGKAHARNSELFWRCRKDFEDRHGVKFEGHGDTTDPGEAACREQTKGWFRTVFSLFDEDPGLLAYLADRLVEQGDAVPERAPGFRFRGANLHADRSWLAVDALPAELYVAPGTKVANKEGFARFGAWLNAVAHARTGRPLVLACSADLADSTSIAGFAKKWGDFPGFGWYERERNPGGALLPQQITEFTNAGLSVGLATVNFADEPEAVFDGYWGACSTYGSFSYLKYGPMRLFSQLAQDCPLQVGKVIWVVGHSGPETAEDSRTHFGIFAPGVTQLFPAGRVINVHPWEHNEVAPMLAAALATDVPIVALHLTRPAVAVPDRAALGVAPHTDAAKGAYVIRPHDPTRPVEGTVLVQGTSTTESVFELLPRFAEPSAPNLKLVAATSWELFRLQPAAYRDAVLPRADWLDSTVVTNGARRLMHDWLPHKTAERYAISPDWDDRWRTGGNVAELKREARIDPDSVWEGLRRFAADRARRLAELAL
ncbi:MAG TPA: 1-deoxy-D-xylulose-5-phosphate synthase N-terminal domain-containing protein [Planctomycetota bacterium]|nr:1-deoxy-D-xylulose-5-phosphate synthase N-terminal domain-containing protein [Planctomycetota bacterium]